MPTTVARTAPRHNGEAIRVLREIRGLSRQDLAAKSGTSYSHLANLELEIKVSSAQLLYRVAAALDVPVGVLLREPLYAEAAS